MSKMRKENVGVSSASRFGPVPESFRTCGSGPLRCMAVTSLNFLPTFLQYFNLYIYCKNVGKKFRLVTAMHRNGPLPQVTSLNLF